MSFRDLVIKEYSEKSVVVYGDTHKYKEDLKKIGGKFNGRLKDGPGWIFPKSREKEINSYIRGGISVYNSNPVETQCNNDYKKLINIVNNMSRKIEKIENAVILLLSTEQREKLDLIFSKDKNISNSE